MYIKCICSDLLVSPLKKITKLKINKTRFKKKKTLTELYTNYPKFVSLMIHSNMTTTSL